MLSPPASRAPPPRSPSRSMTRSSRRSRSKAREHNTYIVFGGVFLDDPGNGACSNAAVVIDRRGRLAGRYVKVHPVLDRVGPEGQIVLEGGVRPGTAYNVLDLDFGRVGVQICYDVEYPEGWRRLAEKGAELVLYPTQSPQLTRPGMYAATHEYWVVSATFRNNASFFEPGTGSSPPRSPNRSKPSSTRSTSATSSSPGRRDCETARHSGRRLATASDTATLSPRTGHLLVQRPGPFHRPDGPILGPARNRDRAADSRPRRAGSPPGRSRADHRSASLAAASDRGRFPVRPVGHPPSRIKHERSGP